MNKIWPLSTRDTIFSCYSNSFNESSLSFLKYSINGVLRRTGEESQFPARLEISTVTKFDSVMENCIPLPSILLISATFLNLFFFEKVRLI